MDSNDKHVEQFKSCHEGRVLTKLNRLRESKVLTDVTFKLEDGEVSAQKTILAGYSDYYEKMFTTGFKEGFNEEVEVKEIKTSILDTLFTFIYLQVIDISDKTVYQLYEASDYLQFDDVKGYCVSFFNKTLAIGNCVSYRSFAQRYQLLELINKCDKFIVDNLESVSKGLNFKELSIDEAEALITLKQKKDFCQDSILKAILSWIKHDVAQRHQFIKRLFQVIDVKKLSLALLKEVVENPEEWIQKTDFFIGVLNPEYITHIKTNQRVVSGEASKVTFEFMIVGGFEAKHNVHIYDVLEKHFRETKASFYERWGSISAKIKNCVYVAGGGGAGRGTNSVECLDLNHVNVCWNNLSSMVVDRWCASSAVLNGQIYVTGGWSGNELSSAEFYKPGLNTWTKIVPMKTTRYQHATVSYKGSLFVFGGCDGLHKLNSMESIQPSEGKWKLLKPMKQKRRGLCGVVYNGEIYAIGGEGLKSVERFNIQTKTWSIVSSLNYKRKGACACVVNKKIYVIGGSGDSESETTIEVYDGMINEWKIETNMDAARYLASVVTL
uniref:BTB domain-containing protein n=1 Tax=Ciona intestinalis TaxID=7719 RepID=F7B7S4_CIOIN